MQQDFKTIGLLDMNILPYLKTQVPSDKYENLKKLLKKHKIKDDDLKKMLIHENDFERLYTITIEGRDDDLYFRVKKGGVNE